ncbi:hypothetical protein Trydic_g6917 [Trypoxylus dichotomus]
MNTCQFQTATGQLIPVNGKLLINLGIGSQYLTIKLLVTEIIDEFILGLYFLKVRGFVIDMTNHVLLYQDEEISLINSEEIQTTARMEGELGGCLMGVAEPNKNLKSIKDSCWQRH